MILYLTGMMTDAKKAKMCPHRLAISAVWPCTALRCRIDCKKNYPPTGTGLCSAEEGFCDCQGPC